eukprot:scaffold87321_cov17-Tisochrysis_lutea.AAC.1
MRSTKALKNGCSGRSSKGYMFCYVDVSASGHVFPRFCAALLDAHTNAYLYKQFGRDWPHICAPEPKRGEGGGLQFYRGP